MAELSALTTSGPALGDPHAAPSIPPSPSPLPAPSVSAPGSPGENAVARSSPCNDNAANTPAARAGGVSLSLQPVSAPPALPPDTPMTFLGRDPASQREASGKDPEPGADVIKQEMEPAEPARAGPWLPETETPLLASHQGEEQPTSPGSKSGPNLYPDVHVTHNPRAGVDAGQLPAGQPQVINTSNPTSGSLNSSDDAAAAAEEEEPQPLEQAQQPQTAPPSEARKAELPLTPTRAEQPSPTIPLIHEPAYSVALPNPNPRPAPDTLSYLESASLMSGTLESLSGLGDDGSSIGSDSEINGLTVRRTDRYGFLGGSQYSDSR